MDVSFEKVQPFLKISKSEQSDNSPYQLQLDVAWYNIIDKHGTTVGQVDVREYNEWLMCIKCNERPWTDADYRVCFECYDKARLYAEQLLANNTSTRESKL